MNATTQGGSTLSIALVFLLILTLLGVTAMRGTSLQERMAGNMRDRDLAFQAAEAALREGERFLQRPVLPPFVTPGDGLRQPMAGALRNIMWSADYNWAESRDYDGLGGEGLAELPRYVIAELPRVRDPEGTMAADDAMPDIQSFRVTARGVGGTEQAVVILQSTFRR